jgi:hypothetical protein
MIIPSLQALPQDQSRKSSHARLLHLPDARVHREREDGQGQLLRVDHPQSGRTTLRRVCHGHCQRLRKQSRLLLLPNLPTLRQAGLQGGNDIQ